MIGFDTFGDLKNDLKHLINITLPQYLNPQQNNTLYHIVSPITPVANSGSCKMITPDGCADITYNRYILNTSKSLSNPSLTQDILTYNADTHISIAQPNIPVNDYHYNVHPDIENYLYLGYNITNALLRNFQLATITTPYAE
ncbi:hypothetical protein [Shewanella surugensis]|uniref:Uncharacterized protein n=1 Tax=Shewanella surugensis TaxID=212020 RepID=A0ABT0LD60_9GAMM|nr:hypothetical protein [Shewanella surugensis]MCL1125262.1 hypothetical protein [Shewanella surugensis]